MQDSELENLIQLIKPFKAGSTPQWYKEQEELMKNYSPKNEIEIAKKLPFSSTPEIVDNPEIWTISFSAVHRTLYMISMAIEHIGAENNETIVAGKFTISHPSAPSKELLVATLLSAMVEPSSSMTGLPHRPNSIIIAHRLQYAFEYISNNMKQLGIECLLESIEDAKRSAAQHGTDYLGRNFRNCTCCQDAKNLSTLKACGRCHQVYYCDKKCQVRHWPSHKLDCKDAAPQQASSVKNNTD